jgi:NADH-quinone oxidoreductase subunit B
VGLEDKLPSGILLTNLERFVNYSRSTSPWPTTRRLR